ncbi:lipopolysaccharide biosynthesis protein [Thermodesulfobacteriota bacterium]
MPNEKTIISAVKKKSDFAGDVLKLVSGTTFAQALSLITAPVLTRLYAPEAYGVLALFGSITGIIGVIVCLRYELAIMLPENDKDAANLLGASLGIASVISLVMIPVFWWEGSPISQWLNTPSLATYLWLAPLVIFIGGVFSVLNYWNSRTRHFGRLSIARVTHSLTTTPLMLCLGFVGHATAGSMIGSGIAGQALATSVLGRQIWRDDGKAFLKAIHWRAMREGIKRYKKFPMFDSWAGLMNTVSAQLPPLLLAFFFSSTAVGFYALGHRLLSMPMSLIGGAVARVFFQRAAVAKNDGTLPLVVRNTFTRLMALGSFPLLLVMVIGKDIFSVVFGSQWMEAGVYAQILAPWLLFVFLGSPISTLFSVLEMQESYLLFNSVLLATRVASLVAGGIANSILISLMLYAGTGTIMWIGLCVYLLWKAGLPIRFLARDALQIMVIAAIALVPLVVLKGYGIQPALAMISGCLSALLYYTILYFRDEDLQRLVARYVGRLFRGA